MRTTLSIGKYLVMCICLTSLAAAQDGATAEPRPASELQTLLALNGLGTEELAKFSDDAPLLASEEPLLMKLLVALRRIPASEITESASPQADWTALRAIPAAHRGDVYRLRGELLSINKVVVLADQRERFEFDDLYRCEVDLPDVGRVAIFTDVMPAHLVEADLPQTVEADALFLKWIGNDDVMPMFAAGRLAWYPRTALGQLGFDVGLLDNIVQRRALSMAESDPFYALLATIDRLSIRDPATLAITAASDAAVVELFGEPERFVGQLVSVQGTLRRAISIHVPDPEIRRRYGIDQYYEVEIFVRVDRLKPELNPLVFVFCLRELPADVQVGDGLHLPVLARGIFFKLWTYESQYARDVGSDLRQIAPLLVGNTLEVLPVATPAGQATGVLLTLAIGSVAAVGLVVWWLNRTDRRRRARASTAEPHSLGDLSDLP